MLTSSALTVAPSWKGSLRYRPALWMSSSCPAHQQFHHFLPAASAITQMYTGKPKMVGWCLHFVLTVFPPFARSSWRFHTVKRFSPNRKPPPPQGSSCFDCWFYFSLLGRFKMSFVRSKRDFRVLGKTDMDKSKTSFFITGCFEEKVRLEIVLGWDSNWAVTEDFLIILLAQLTQNLLPQCLSSSSYLHCLEEIYLPKVWNRGHATWETQHNVMSRDPHAMAGFRWRWIKVWTWWPWLGLRSEDNSMLRI